MRDAEELPAILAELEDAWRDRGTKPVCRSSA
jgi:hypothetical protein